MTATAATTSSDSHLDAPPARRVVVLGLGRVGLAYAMAAATHAGCALAGLVEPRGELRRFARGAGFAAPSAATLSQWLARGAADVAVVASPPAERGAAIEGAVAAGLAVLVDGLPAAHAEGAARLEPVIAGARARVGCAGSALFHPLFARAARILAAGALGEVREVRASVYVSRVFAAGASPAGGDVLEFALADMLVLLDALFGPPRTVAATANRLYGERIDEVHARLQLPGVTAAVVDASWSVPGYPRASLVVEVLGERGSLLASDDALEAELPVDCAGLGAGHSRRLLADEPDDVAFEAGEPARALAAFVRVLASGASDPALDPARALRVARTLDALRKSAAAAGAEREIAS